MVGLRHDWVTFSSGHLQSFRAAAPALPALQGLTNLLRLDWFAAFVAEKEVQLPCPVLKQRYSRQIFKVETRSDEANSYCQCNRDAYSPHKEARLVGLA